MLTDVVTALRPTEISDIIVAAGGPAAFALASELGVSSIPDAPGPTDLDAVLSAVVRTLPHGVDVLVVAADLPRLTTADVDAVLHTEASVVCAPTHGNGTAALLRRPGDRISTAYGADSARRHRTLAARAGVGFEQVVRDGFLHDVDTIDDVVALRCAKVGSATARALELLRVDA